MGKTGLHASCINSIVDILLQRLVIQCHYNHTLPDLANVSQKTIVAGFITTDIETITTRFTIYRIAGMFGGFNVWRIAELKVIGEIKFGEWIDFGHKVLLPAKIWLVKVW